MKHALAGMSIYRDGLPRSPLSQADLPLTGGGLPPIDDMGKHRRRRGRLMDVDGIPCLCYNMRANLTKNDTLEVR